MTVFEDLSATSWDLFSTYEGRSLTYTQQDGTSLGSITGVRRDAGNTDAHRVRRYLFKSSTLSSPARGDTITDGSEVWTVAEVEDPRGVIQPLLAQIPRLYSHGG